MAGSRSVLGRGIGALIPTVPTAQQRPDYFLCALDRIRPMRGQPRTQFDDEALGELASSIAHSGVLQPLLVRRDGSDYVLIAGERRWRAARRAGLSEVPVVVKEASDGEAFTFALVENLQRADLSPLEMAEACQRLIDEHGLTQAEVAERIGKSRSAVANTLRLLKLSEPAQDALAQGRISEGHARQLVGLEPGAQAELLASIETEALSVRATEAQARLLRSPEPGSSLAEPAPSLAGPEPGPPLATEQAPARAERRAPGSRQDDVADPALDPAVARELTRAAEQLQRALGTRVRIETSRPGAGQIRIHFDSPEVLEGLVERLLEAAGAH